MARTHLRLAAGVCMLSTGLFIGSAGAIAAADTDASGSASGGQAGTDGSSQGDSPTASPTASSAGSAGTGPTGSVAGTPRKTVWAVVTDALSSLGKSGQQQSPAANLPDPELAATDTKDEQQKSALNPAVPSPVASVPDVTAPAPNVVAPLAAAVESVPKVVESIQNVVDSVQNVVTVTRMAVLVPTVVESLPSLVAPVADVITSVQEMLTSVEDSVVLLVQVQPDLPTLLGVAAAAGGSEGIAGAGPSAADAPVLATRPSLPLVPPVAGMPGVPLAGNATEVAKLGAFAATYLGEKSSLPGMPSEAPSTANSIGAPFLFGQTFSELLIPASLSALAAVALPGVAGLLIITAAGMRVGYRQAKAALALRTAGVEQFAGPGPLGVVRSGSLVVLSPRVLRVARSEPSAANCLLEQVA